MKTVIIGDIHGGIKPFKSLLKKAGSLEEGDMLILLGDLIDRGNDSWAVWQRVMKLKKRMGTRLVVLRGNHECYWMTKKQGLLQWVQHLKVGRLATIRSFRRQGADLNRFEAWLKRNTVSYHVEEHFQCVHAGIMVNPPQANDMYTLMHDHMIVSENRYDGPLTVTGHIGVSCATWFAGDKKTKELYRPGRKYPLPEKGVICIDTGCGKGGKLTAMVIEGEEFELFESE